MTDDQEGTPPAVPAGTEPSASIEIPPPPPTTGKRGSGSSLSTVLAVLALGAVVVLAVFLGLSLSSLSDEHSLDAARTSALAAARVDAGELASYDYRNLAAHFKDVEDRSDAKFAKKFESTSGALEKVLAQYHAVAKAKVLKAGIVSVSASRAQVILFVDQTVTNSQVTTPTTDRSRILITLVRPGSTWLLDQLEVL